ncbi:hypothetical protein N7508_002013 [Penicillium antarcticum]|uniref:uncharacterized protein n=1 Tax=Penicillium antarcticum TaxID=416450 RepID=UPI002399DD84|nr:uncharacterized protein N7508_002013 [Penicillium antarcticum]KAJ5317505.1 hypothetical protein N7508_002013 [Penicillium antarcticum]
MASLWYCCGCNFGPHNSSLYDSCIQCGVRRCARCTEEKISDSINMDLNMSSHSHSHSHSHSCDITSPYPAAVHMDSPHTGTINTRAILPQVPELPGVRPLLRAEDRDMSSSSLAGARVHGATYMYICCNCGDGPKIYNVQPKCIECDHVACSSCTNVK